MLFQKVFEDFLNPITQAKVHHSDTSITISDTLIRY